MICKRCNLFEDRIFSPDKTGNKPNKTYVNKHNRPWHGHLCPKCHLVKCTERVRKLGIVSRDDVMEPANRLGRQSEIKAKAHFESLGFIVDMTTGTGPDLLLDIAGIKGTCEVKTVCRDKHSPNKCVVGTVSPNRRMDDLIAFVFPNDSIVIDSMESHLSACGRSGMRMLTRIWKRLQQGEVVTSLS